MQQTTAQKAPAQPVTGVTYQGGAALGVARELTPADYRAMKARLRDLRSELQDAAERRNSIAEHLSNADVAARPGYLARLELLDKRILAIETEITNTVALLGTAPPSAMDFYTEVRQGDQIAQSIVGDIVPIVGILSVFVFAPIAIALSRFIWRRAVAPGRPAITDHATQQRLETLQQAVDTIAIEVERISEGQRFVTRMLSERSVGAGDADALQAPKKSAVHSER